MKTPLTTIRLSNDEMLSQGREDLCLTSCTATCSGKRIEAQVPEKLTIRGDIEKIARALSNILDNAVKYNYDGGEIHLDAEKTDTFVTLHVANTGDGIPEAESDKVFNQFYRVESSRSSRYGGSGLGLAIVKRIVELHGGDVTMTTKPAGWTKLTVLFPKPPDG